MAYDGIGKCSPENSKNMITRRKSGGYILSVAPEPEYEVDWSTLRSEQGGGMVCCKPKPQKISLKVKKGGA